MRYYGRMPAAMHSGRTCLAKRRSPLLPDRQESSDDRKPHEKEMLRVPGSDDVHYCQQ